VNKTEGPKILPMNQTSV